MNELTELLSGNLDTVAIFGLFVYLWHRRALARDLQSHATTLKALELASKCVEKESGHESGETVT